MQIVSSRSKPPLVVERMSFRDHLTRTLIQMLGDGQAAVIGTAIVCLVTVPLYAIDYHLGQLPVFGFCLSLAIGAALMPVLIGTLARDKDPRAWTRLIWIDSLLAAAAIGLIVGPALYWVLNTGVSMAGFISPVISHWVANDNAYAWKPIWHVALGASILLGVAPVLVNAIPLRLRAGLSLREACRYVWRRVEGRHYDPMAVTLGMAAVGLVVGILPGAGVFVPILLARLSLTLFSHVFSTK